MSFLKALWKNTLHIAALGGRCLRDKKLPQWAFKFNRSCSSHEKNQHWEIKQRFKSSIQVTNWVICNLFAASKKIQRLPVQALINCALSKRKDAIIFCWKIFIFRHENKYMWKKWLHEHYPFNDVITSLSFIFSD